MLWNSRQALERGRMRSSGEMRTFITRAFASLCLSLAISVLAAPEQYVLFNISRTPDAEAFRQIHDAFPQSVGTIQFGAGAVFSYLRQPRNETMSELKQFLQLAQQSGTPVVIQLDGENWWDGRPDLWNWWEPSRAGYSPGNRANVEWSGWSPDDVIKIAWRNWGSQLRVLPPPNLMSPAYRQACHEEMSMLVPVVLDWWRALPPSQKSLFVGIKLGWESSIGVNAWYYTNGNALLEQPASNDPTNGLRAAELPARGVAQIGYAAVKTAGIRSSGELTEADLAEVARRHLEDLCELAAKLGVPRDRLFTHAGGWKDGELLYQTAVNEWSCPGWSFYRHASDPRQDLGVQGSLAKSDAPYWAAVEWFLPGTRDTVRWQQALTATLSAPRCRYVCIYNWESVRDQTNILSAVRNLKLPAAGAADRGH
jgi:hypothetical protein